MTQQVKVVVSTKVPTWFRRELGIKAATESKTISDYVYGLLKLGLRREKWLEKEVERRSSPQLEFPPIVVETLDD